MAVALSEPTWTVGDRMWKARRNAGLEQADVANELGVSRALVSRWERDQSDPGVLKLQAFAELTGVPVGWLISDSRWSTHLTPLPDLHGQMELSLSDPLNPAPGLLLATS